MNVQEMLGDFRDSVTDYDIDIGDFYSVIKNNRSLTFGEWTDIVANHMQENYMVYRRDIYEWVSKPKSDEAVNEYMNNIGWVGHFDLTEMIQRAYVYDVSAQLLNEEDDILEYALLCILDEKGYTEIDDEKYTAARNELISTSEVDFDTIVEIIKEEIDHGRG